MNPSDLKSVDFPCPKCGTRIAFVPPPSRFALANGPDDAQALADVRTLDEYVEKLGRGFGWTVSVYRGGVYGVVFTNDNWEEQQGVPCLEGATPDEARAKAAAWVREQAQKVQESAYRWPVLCARCGHPESHGVHGIPAQRGQHEFEDPNDP